MTVQYRCGASLSAGTTTLRSGDNARDDTIGSSRLSPQHAVSTPVLAVAMAWDPERVLAVAVADLEGREAALEGEAALGWERAALEGEVALGWERAALGRVGAQPHHRPREARWAQPAGQ